MIKTNIKLRVNPEQSKRVQEICFENGIYWQLGSLSRNINNTHIGNIAISGGSLSCLNAKFYNGYSNFEEIDADLFIRTNGSCEEYNEWQNDGESGLYYENIQLKKKIENLHIVLNKQTEKNNNQAIEIGLLLKQKEELKDVWKMNFNEIKKLKEDEKILLFRIDEGKKELANQAIRTDKTLILLKEEREKSKTNNLDMQIHLLEIMEFKNQLQEKDTIIKYLENRLTEK